MRSKMVPILIGCIIFCLVAWYLFFTPPQTSIRTSDGKVVVSVWYPWGGDNGEAARAVIDMFNQNNSKIMANAVFAPASQSNNQKLFLAIAGGLPPDVIFVPSSEISTYAARGAIEPIDEVLEDKTINPEDFWPAALKEATYDGKLYALPYCSDACFALFYNKELLRQAGLPERGPRTIAELEEYNKKLTVFKNGQLERIGIIPWAIYGSDNAFYTWSLIFGGKLFDDQKQIPTLQNPQNIKTMQWMAQFAQTYDLKKISGMTSSFTSRDIEMFYYGRLALMPALGYVIQEIKEKAPDLEYGVAALPTLDGSDATQRSWVGGWCMAVPRGARNKKEALQIIKYTCASPEGTQKMGELTGFFPGFRKSPYYDFLRKDERYKTFLDILANATQTRPVHPASGFIMRELTNAIQYSLYGIKSPEIALKDANDIVLREIERLNLSIKE